MITTTQVTANDSFVTQLYETWVRSFCVCLFVKFFLLPTAGFSYTRYLSHPWLVRVFPEL